VLVRSRIHRFDYSLPDHAVAQVPLEPRDSARLLVAVDPGGGVEHRRVRELPDLLEPGDLLVLNETKVLPARLHLRKATGGRVEVLLLEPTGTGEWEALVRPGRRVPPGTKLATWTGRARSLTVEVGEDLGDGRRRVRLLVDDGDELATLDIHGEVALPPYITTPLADSDRYQTVYAARPGSVAAPTAGLHLTTEVLDRCRTRGAEIATVELDVGLDTFRPITAERPEDHRMHSERYRVPAATMDACARARRVVAVGTTTVRALESAARGAREGRTELFIRDDYPFKVVDVLLTNFHLPRSSLLLLLDAFAGERWRELYAAALDDGYRFLSFGDAMLVARRP
jgi:S-adenosylmethionine:tRNA ribosyltransferase-isomerase